MTIKEHVNKACKGRYKYLECDNVDGTDVITLGTESEPFALNFEIGDKCISVSIIDKDKHEVIDDYDDVFETPEDLDELLNTAVDTYESMIKIKPRIIENKEKQEYRKLADEAAFHLNSIITCCEDYMRKFIGNYDALDEDTGFKEYQKTLSYILYEVKDASETILNSDIRDIQNISESNKLTESPSIDGENDDNENNIDRDSNDKDYTITDDTLESATVSDLLNTAADKIETAGKEQEDELNSKLLDDIALDLRSAILEVEPFIVEDDNYV